MVKRRLTLAEVVCAVYSLNKPGGATKKEILKFCKLRYGYTSTGKEFARILEKGLDEGLLTSFHKRYYVTKLRCGLLWEGESGGVYKKSRAKRGKTRIGRKVKKTKVPRKRNLKGKTKTLVKGKGVLEDCIEHTSSLYTLWKREFKRQVHKMKSGMKKISKRGKCLCKKIKSTGISKSKQPIVKNAPKETNKNRGRVTKIKNLIKLKKIAKGKKPGANKSLKLRKVERNNKCRKISKGSLGGDGNGVHRERYRSLLRQTKNAVVHGRSWDKLNYSRQKRMRENQDLVKKSQLVQKILTQKHAASWDNFNSKLKNIKKKATCSSQERPNGDGASQHDLVSL